MIYSASRRTDLVAFFPDHIVQKVKRSRKLEAIVLWTKDPRNLISHPSLLEVTKQYPTIIQLTITGLAGTSWEPEVPPLQSFKGELKELGSALPQKAIVWRFDPIISSPDVLERFTSTLMTLRDCLGDVDEVTVSFPDPYPKVVKRLQECNLRLPMLTTEEQARILDQLLAIGRSECPEFTINLCCEPELFSPPDNMQAHCIEGERFDSLYATRLGSLTKDRGQRVGCGCVQSTDIGSYDQVCRHGCRYCYASPG